MKLLYCLEEYERNNFSFLFNKSALETLPLKKPPVTGFLRLRGKNQFHPRPLT